MRGVSTNSVILLLRSVLVLAAGLVLLLQVMSIPGSIAHQAEQDGGFAASHWVALAVAEAELLCVQVVVVATWMLLGMVRAERIFSDAAFRWVDLIIAALAVAWLVWLGFGISVLAVADDPGGPLLVGVLGVGITVVTLLMVVMRTLLHQATEWRADLETVI